MQRKLTAFTLIELLVVVAIIGLLVAVLLPAFGVVRRNARYAQASAQFAALDTGLNMFRGEQALGGTLPPSTGDKTGSAGDFQLIANPRKERGGNDGQDPIRIAGAHLLVHAMVGADLLGPPGFRDLNRNGTWWDDTHDAPGDGNKPDGLYALDESTGDIRVTRYGGGFVDDKMKERMFSLRHLENKGLIQNLTAAPGDTAKDELLFVDPWDMPILYYRANSYNARLVTGRGSNEQGVYRQEDNGLITGTEQGIVNHPGLDFGAGKVNDRLHAIFRVPPLPPPAEKDAVEKILDGPEFEDSFARFILDPSVSARPTPVRKDSYLLISAGPDARYGSADDVTNWTREQQ